MEAPQRRWNDAQEKAFSFPLFSAKRRPKAAVQAFKDREKQFLSPVWHRAHFQQLIT